MEFNQIANDIITHEKYQALAYEDHHGLSRYEHSIRVAKTTYKITKALGLDYKSATRAALLHDFYTNEDLKEKNKINRLRTHPEMALENARNYFGVNDIEANAIRTHMFPLTFNLPTSKEAAIVNMADNVVAIYECSRYKLQSVLTLWMLFVFNVITYR